MLLKTITLERGDASYIYHLGQFSAPDTFCIAHAHFIPVVGLEKERCTIIVPWRNLIRQHPVTGITLRTTGPVPADSRQ